MNLEIEYKFLIKMPSEKLLSMLDVVEITQNYLNSEYPNTRVRRSASREGIKYTKTMKIRISDVVREEYEESISKEEYERLLEFSDPERNTIKKKRYILIHGGKQFEIDVFDFWKNVCVMEIELAFEGEEFELPPEIEIISNVTNDMRFTNRAMSLKIPDIDNYINF